MRLEAHGENFDFDQSNLEKQMSEEFYRSTQEVLSSEGRFKTPPSSLHFSLKVEYGLLNRNFEPLNETLRDAIDQDNSGLPDPFRGTSQVVICTNTFDLFQLPTSILQIESDLTSLEDVIRQKVRGFGGYMLRIGANPLVAVSDIVPPSSEENKKISTYFNKKKRVGLPNEIGSDGVIKVDSTRVTEISNASVLRLSAIDFNDAVDKMNRGFMISPMAIALSGNTRFYEGKDSHLADARLLTWEHAYDSRGWGEVEANKDPRVGIPNSYYKDLEDYFNRILQYPFLLNRRHRALETGIQLHLMDSRISINPQLSTMAVEFRPVSAQRNPFENIAAMAFYLGRLQWSQQNEELLDIDKVKENRINAMHNGIRGTMWTNLNGRIEELTTQEALLIELQRAKLGLAISAVPQEIINKYFDILEKRIIDGFSPSDLLSQKIRISKEMGMEKEEAIILGMNTNGNLI